MSIQDDEVKLTLRLLKESFSSPDKKQQKEIIEKLKELSKDYYHHIQVLIKSISLESDLVTLDLKKSIGIYMKNIINSRKGELKDEELLSILQFILETVIHSNLPQQVLCFFYDMVTSITGSNLFVSTPSHIYQVMTYLATTITQAQSETFLKKVFAVISLLNSLLISKAINIETIEEILKQFLLIIDAVFAAVPNYINPTNEINIDFIIILKIGFDLIYSLVNKLRAMKFDYSKLSFLFQKYGLYTYELITLTIRNKDTNSIIYIIDDKKLEEQINFMKGKAIQFLSILIQSSPNVIKDDQLVKTSSELIMIFIKNLKGIIETNLPLIHSFSEGDLKDGIHHLLYHVFTFMMRALMRNPIKDNFAPLVNDFILDIIIPVIISTSNDNQKIKDSGEEYYHFVNDLVADHKIKSLRTAAVSLLQKICDKYVDTYTFVLSLILQLLDHILSEDKNNRLKYHLLTVIKPNSIIATMTDEYKLDLCFLVLILLHETVIDNCQYFKILRNILINYKNKLASITSPLIIDKICLFQYFYLIPLFIDNTNENAEYFQLMFHYLMNVLLNSDKYPGLGFQSASTLKEILLAKTNQHQPVFNQIINLNMSKINTLIEESEVYLFFDILLYIAEFIKIEDNEVQYWFISKITRRIHKEILANTQNYIKEKGFIILEKFLKNNSLMDNQNPKLTLEVFETLIQPIVAYLKNPSKIDFEDDIIELMEILVKTTHTITPLSFSIVPLLQLTVEKNKSLSDVEYNYLTVFMKNDPNGEKVQACLNEILTMIYQGYQINEYDGNDLSLLLSLGLLERNIIINEANFISLLSKAYQILADFKNSQQKSKMDSEEEYIFQSAVGVLCTSMISKPEETMAFLQNNNYFIDFLVHIRILFNLSFYSVKIYKQIILGLCSLIHNQKTQQAIISMDKMNQISLMILTFVNKQKYEETQLVNKIMKKELNCNFIKENDSDNESDDDDDDSDDDDLNDLINDGIYDDALAMLTKNKNYKYIDGTRKFIKLIDKMPLQNDTMDEYSIFSQCLQGLNKTNLMSFFETLSDQEKNLLGHILKFKKVEVKYNDQIMSVPRRTLKIKRNNEGQSIPNPNGGNETSK